MKSIATSLLFLLVFQNTFAVNGITELPNPLIVNQRSASMAVTANGTIFCGFSNGLMKHENNTWSNYNTSNSNLNSNSIYLLNYSLSNELLIATDIGISIFDGTTFVNNSYANIGVPNVTNAIEKVQNNLWIGTNQGLYKYDGTTLTSYNVANNKLNNDTVLQLKLWNNEMWVATKNGLTKIDNINNSFTYLTSNSAIKQNYIYDINIFQNKLYIAYKANFADFLNVQYFDGNIFSQLNDVGMKTKIDSYYNINRIKTSPEGLILGNLYGELLKFNVVSKKVISTGSNFPLAINFDWHSINNSIVISYITSNTPVSLLDFLSFDCFGCEKLIKNNKYIDINNVRASMSNRGIMNTRENFDYNEYLINPSFEFPKGINNRIFLPNSLWIGGLDNNNNLHLAAQTYRQNGDDYWPGPINVASGTTDTTTAIAYDKIWKINRFDVEEFKWAFLQGTVQNGSYVVPEDIIDWPANGNTLLNQNLAPFFDANGDDIYAPLQDGDYPIIKGDQMLYWIFNDKLGNHVESGGLALGVEVHASVYAFQCDSFPDSLQIINNTLFYNFDIINRSNNNYSNFCIASWQDPDLQIYNDNAVASIPSNNLSYSYSTSQNLIIDSLYKGLKIGNIILNGPTAPQNDGIDNNNNGQVDEPNEKCLLNYSMNFKNDATVNGNPQSAIHFYQYMQSKWKDNTPLTYGNSGYGGSNPVNFGFDGQPWDTTTWNCEEAADWRIVQAAGPVNFLAGDTINFEYAFVNHMNTNLPWQSQSIFEDFFHDVQTIRNLYNQGNIPSCLTLDVSLPQKTNTEKIKLFPNPANNYFQLNSSNEKIQSVLFYDINGSTIAQLNTNDFNIQVDVQNISAGIYFIKVNTKTKIEHFKLIKQ